MEREYSYTELLFVLHCTGLIIINLLWRSSAVSTLPLPSPPLQPILFVFWWRWGFSAHSAGEIIEFWRNPHIYIDIKLPTKEQRNSGDIPTLWSLLRSGSRAVRLDSWSWGVTNSNDSDSWDDSSFALLLLFASKSEFFLSYIGTVYK